MARSKSVIIRENLKLEPKNEYGKNVGVEKDDIDDSQEEAGSYGSREGDGTDICRKGDVTYCSQKADGTYGSQERDCTEGNREGDATYDSQEEICTNDSCNKKDEFSIFYGTHDTQVSEGGEADLHKHVVSCKKNPGHTQFVPVNDFNLNHLPEDHHDHNLVEYIKCVADLTVRVANKMTSTERPEFWPNTNQPYPFYVKKGSEVMKLGTGMVTHTYKWTEENIKKLNIENCQCHKCQNSDTPSKVWGEVRMFTATHVVFDDFEARHTTCRLFYDRKESPLVTLDGWTIKEANIKEDRCELKCVTCDIELLDELDKMVEHWRYLWKEVHNKYKKSKDEDRLSFIVSHPHGCPKQISVGRWISMYKVNSFSRTQYTYTTCTCPGSSGAPVHSLGYDDWLYYAYHVHSGVNTEGINFSGIGRDYP